MTDFRYALRSLARARWFTVAAVLTCALGVGVALAVFSVVDRMMFRPLPFDHPESLVQIHRLRLRGADARLMLDHLLIVEFRQSAKLIEDIALVRSVPPLTPGDSDGERPLAFAGATWNLLPTLGITPAIGAGFSVDDARAKRDMVLLTHEAWRARFGGDTSVMGQTLESAGNRYEIAGVLPPRFILPTSQLREHIDGLSLAPLTFDEPASAREIMTAPIARLRDGVTPMQAQAELNAIAAALAARSPDTVVSDVAGTIQLHPLRDGITLLYRTYLTLITLGVFAVLILACVNLSTLLVARGRLRDREMAVRIALGASRRRLVMTTVFESVLVALVGSAVAWLSVRLAGGVILSFVPPAFRGFAVPATDLRVIGLALLVALAAALLSAFVPARQAARRDVRDVLQQATRSGRRTPRTGKVLVALQAGLAALLVTGAALSAQSFSAMAFEYQGSRPEGLYRVSTSAGYSRAWRGEPWRDDRGARAIPALRGLPGVVAVGSGTGLPVEGAGGRVGAFWPRASGGWEYGVSASMFDTLGVTPLAGRVFSDDDVRSRAPVAVLSAAGARALFPGADPASVIGRTFPYTNGTRLTVVGVIADVSRHPGDEGAPLLFVPSGTPGLSGGGSSIYLAVRVAPGRALDEQAVVDRVGEALGPGRVRIDYVPDIFGPHLQRPRFQAVLFGTLAWVALIVAAIGLFALATVDVTSRRYEIGVRMSLGATARDIHRQFVRSAITPVLVGAAAGLVVAFWAGKFLQAFLFEIDARDVWTQAIVALILIATAECAAWLPARRAARVNPVEMLQAG